MLTPTFQALAKAFHFPVMLKLWKYLVPIGLYSVFVVVLHHRFPELTNSLPVHRTVEAALTGILFGLFMTFRTNIAYARWWEGRVLWGQLVNESRNLSLKSARVFKADKGKAEAITKLIGDFAAALRDHLRQASPSVTHAPLVVAGKIYDLIYLERKDPVDGWATLALDDHAKKLMDVCGGCERLKNTPLTPSYRSLIRKGIVAYFLALPWFLIDDLGSLTILAAILTGYVLIGLELIGSRIENPFSLDGDNLPLDDLVTTIRKLECP